MQEIVIRNNGSDGSVFVDVNNLKIRDLYFSTNDEQYHKCTLEFDFGRLDHNHKHEQLSEVWTGKFICVANRSKSAMWYNYSPGMIYEVTEKYVYDNTSTPLNRGKCWIFSCGDFKTLKKEFAEYYDIDIIEYKGESGKDGRK